MAGATAVREIGKSRTWRIRSITFLKRGIRKFGKLRLDMISSRTAKTPDRKNLALGGSGNHHGVGGEHTIRELGNVMATSEIMDCRRRGGVPVIRLIEKSRTRWPPTALEMGVRKFGKFWLDRHRPSASKTSDPKHRELRNSKYPLAK